MTTGAASMIRSAPMCVGATGVSRRRLLRSVAVSLAMLSVWPAWKESPWYTTPA
jgi:hypothetical protein